jgi:hypothetical protein
MTSLLPSANAIVMPAQPGGEAVGARILAMSLNYYTTVFAKTVGCLGLVGVLAAATPVAGQPAPQRVTSDTPEYCLRLLDRVSDLVRVATPPPPQEVASLSSEGQRMCDQGHTRGGILRLRRALMLMLHGNEH